MSAPHRKRRGAESQVIAAAYCARTGWPYALPVGAGSHGADITGCPGVAWEVKARRGLDLGAALRQAQNHPGDVHPVVIRPDGYGPATVELWPCAFTFAEAVRLLRMAGYGDPIGDDA